MFQGKFEEEKLSFGKENLSSDGQQFHQYQQNDQTTFHLK
jgi:hypothetical protein